MGGLRCEIDHRTIRSTQEAVVTTGIGQRRVVERETGCHASGFGLRMESSDHVEDMIRADQAGFQHQLDGDQDRIQTRHLSISVEKFPGMSAQKFPDDR